MSATRWLRLSVDGLDVVVDASSFRRTLPAPAPLPAAIDAGGESYVVIAPGTLGRGPSGPPPQLLLLLAGGGARVAIPAAEIAGTLTAPPDAPAPLPWPYDGEPAWCAGVIRPAAAAEPPLLALDLAALARGAAAERLGAVEAVR
jgi:hypothetical protein